MVGVDCGFVLRFLLLVVEGEEGDVGLVASGEVPGVDGPSESLVVPNDPVLFLWTSGGASNCEVSLVSSVEC